MNDCHENVNFYYSPQFEKCLKSLFEDRKILVAKILAKKKYDIVPSFFVKNQSQEKKNLRKSFWVNLRGV